LDVTPNPFSPYVKPIAEFGQDAQYGTCISFTPDAKEPTLEYAWVRIYNVVGDLVYSVKVPSAEKKEYRLWWDGKTTDKEIHWINENDPIETSRMCRNGRYFLVLTVRDVKKKEKHYKKPIMLFK